MKNLDDGSDEDVAVQMGPLIDCVFLLLIFFMVVALTKKSQWEYQAKQPSARVTAEAEEVPGQVSVSVDARGVFRINDVEGTLDAPALGTYLQSRADEAHERPVLINTDEMATLGMVMPVLDACNQFGFNAFHVRLLRNPSYKP